MSKQYDLEERLLDYAAAIINVTEQMKPTRAGNHVAGQLLRSGTSSLFNHGEAEGAESPRDFSHKLSICLKELKESRRGLRLAAKVPLIDNVAIVATVLAETDELIRIFGAAIRTTRKNIACEENPEYGDDEALDH
jgi:four helix bundle protein